MRESSFQFTKEDSQQMKSQGGEKKVMKKSLSLILAIAMVFTMFASVAFAAEASLDTNAKYEELKKAGIFEGTDGGAAALDQPLTRAQFAKIIVKVLDLKEDAASASIFNDLAGAGWASGFIGAAVKAGLVEGVAPGKFDPSANVTTEQLAKLLVLGLKLQQSNDAVTGNVSAWAKGYVAAAIKANLIPASADYTKPALRAALVEATYAAKEIIAKGQQPATVGIASVKATSAQVLTVSFTGAVDTAKAKFAVKRDESAVTVKEVKFSDDKKSATLTFESKLVEADYEVTLSGIDNLDSAKAKATAKVEAEKVSKIEFITASETLPQKAENVRIEFKVVNQYGEDAKVTADDLEIDVTGVDDADWETVGGKSAIELDLSDDNEYERNDRINVQITDEENHISASKVFTIGDEQYISKVEIGKLLDKAGKEISSVEEGDDDVYLQVFAYDQYGVRVLDEEILSDDIDLSGASDIDVYDVDADRFAEDVDDDDFPDLRLQVEADADEGEQTITIFGSGSSASKKITILTESKPASVKFDVSSITLSTLDGNVGSTDSSSVLYATYVPITVLNEAGDALTKDEIATAAQDELLEVDTSGSADDAYIVESGAFKGQVYVKGENDTGSGNVEITIDNKPNEKATLKVNVKDARDVQEIRLTSNNGDKGINIGADQAETKFKFAAFDQYDAVATEDLYNENKDGDTVDYVVQLTLTGPGAASLNLSDGQTLYSNFNTANGALSTSVAGISTWTANTAVYGTFDQISNKEIKLKGSAVGVYKVKAELLKKEQGDNAYSQVDEVTKSYEVLDTAGETYVWSAALDKGVKDANGVYVVPNLGNLATTSNTDIEQLGKEVKIIAKDGSETILVPKAINDVTLTNADAVKYVTGGKAFIAAGDDKETTLTVNFKTNKGNDSVALKIKGINDPFNISEFTGGKTVRVVAKADLAVGDDIWAKDLLDEIKGVDKTYGTEYSKDELGNAALGITYSIVEKQFADDNLVIDPNGNISALSLNHASGSFTIKLTAPSGAEKLLELGYN